MKSLSFEIRCSGCGFREPWGLEQAVRALIGVGKLRADTDFDADLISELFRVHAGAVACPNCAGLSTLSARKALPGDWDWDDVVRCEDCGKPIPEARLRAVPGATRCRDCQENFER